MFNAFPQPYLIIAATGQHHGLTVVSRDTSEFVKARVPILDPWAGVSA
jgi:toxin FitB